MQICLGASVEGIFHGRASATWPTLEEAVQGIVSLGFGVEVWGGRGEEDPKPASDVGEKIREIASEAPFTSVHTRFDHWTWDPNGLRWEIAFSHAVGGGVLVLHCGSLGLDDPSSRADFSLVKRLAHLARQAGVCLALENGWNTLWALDRVLDAIGDDPGKTNLGICMDVGHAHLSKDAGRQPVRAYLERYRAQLVHLHLHDNHGETDDHLPPGRGTIDWPDLYVALEEIGYAGPAVIELHPQRDPLEELKEAREFLIGLQSAIP